MIRKPVRLAALTGAAAVALGLATPTVAAAMERTTTVAAIHSTATPIDHAGNTITVRMPTTHYAATAGHRDAVVTAAASPKPLEDTITGQQPANGVTPAYQQQTPTAASGGSIAVGTVATLLLLVLVGFGVKHNNVKATWAILCAVTGVFLGSTIFGSLSTQLGGTVVASLSSILSSL